MWNRFAPRLRRALFTALEYAGSRGDEEAAVEDLLAAVLLDTESAAAFVVESAGLSPAAVAKNVLRSKGTEGERKSRASSFAPALMQLLDVAKIKSNESHDLHIGSEHVLEALLMFPASEAAQSLAPLTPDAVDAAVRQWVKLRMPRRRGNLTRFVSRRPALRPVLGMLRGPMLAYQVYVQKSLGHPGFVSDPYPLYAKLRRRDPVRRDPIAPVWVLTRYADVAAYLRDPRFVKDPFSMDMLPNGLRARMQTSDDRGPGFMPEGPQSMLFLDPPRHTRIRGLFNKAFTPRTLQRLRPRIEQVTHRLLDQAQPGGRMDLIRELAYPLPTVVIAELLGFPAADYERLKKWSDDFAATLSFSPTADKQHRAEKSREEMRVYFDQVAQRLRDKPADNLISALIVAELDEIRLSTNELFANCVLLMAAGHETTTNLIGNGMLALLRHPDQFELLRTDPSLIESAVEELLRFDSPVQWTSRIAAEALVIGGKQISRGDLVVGSLGAANRDPSQFAEPDRLDITRRENRHIAFGTGIHFCIGAALAKMEGGIAIGALVQRFPKIRLERSRLRWRPGGVFRGVESLPVRWE